MVYDDHLFGIMHSLVIQDGYVDSGSESLKWINFKCKETCLICSYSTTCLDDSSSVIFDFTKTELRKGL